MDCNFKKELEYKKKKYFSEDITGAKVKIDTEKLLKRGASTTFTKFLNESKDKEFTAELDIKNHYSTMYTLKEDESPVKWLFHIEDLILVSNFTQNIT